MALSKRALEIQQQRSQLPITQGKDAILREILENDVTIILGETGSGKTTQIPQYLLESDNFNGQIAVTQPRRVAATSLATRVSLEQGRQLGTLVGYSVRFEERTTPATRIKYLTDGMLVREMMSDPLLQQYSVVVVDEAHERTLRTDIVLASLKAVLAARNSTRPRGPSNEPAKKPLKVVIMSATLDAEKFSAFFGSAKMLYVKGRQHPVQIFYTTSPQRDYLDSALRTFFQIHLDQPLGDVLVFLPGQEDIENLDASIRNHALQLPEDAPLVSVCALYASLPNEQQAAVFKPAPAGHRKCILATNIAETSITIPGVKYVIDAGKQKEKRHITRAGESGVDTLFTVDITKSSAIQRAGRAGREGKGYCYRLYTEDAFNKMKLSAEPEIRRCNVTTSMLQLKCIGQNMEELEFMDPPDPEAIGASLRTLLLLGALDNIRALTELGKSMATFPLEPEYAAIAMASIEHRCTFEIIDVLSIMSASSPLFPDSASSREAALEARSKFRHPAGDHLTWLNVMHAYDELSSRSAHERREWCKDNFVSERALRDACDIRKQLRQVCEKMGLDWRVSAGQNEAPVLQSLTRGLILQSALLQPDGTYKQTFARLEIKVHPSSSLSDRRSPALIYNELVSTTNVYARGVSAIPHAFISRLPIIANSRSTSTHAV